MNDGRYLETDLKPPRTGLGRSRPQPDLLEPCFSVRAENVHAFGEAHSHFRNRLLWQAGI
jgi:hypothetical protein